MRLPAIHSMIAIALIATAGPAVAQQHVEGQVGPGALYALDMPAAWNGDLVVYAHGIVDPVLPVALPSSQDHFAILRNALMDRGFAVATAEKNIAAARCARTRARARGGDSAREAAGARHLGRTLESPRTTDRGRSDRALPHALRRTRRARR